MQTTEHYCTDPDAVPLDTMFKRGKGRGSRVLVVGQWPAANGWRKTGKAFLTPEGEMLRSGKNLNALLDPLGHPGVAKRRGRACGVRLSLRKLPSDAHARI